MTKQVINIGASANDGTGDPLRNAFDKVNDNFNELYTNGSTNGTTLIDLFDSSGNLDLYNKPHKVSFLYSTEAALKAISAATYHGCIGHAHDTGSVYYAHGSWRRLLSDNSNNDITSYTDPLSKHVYSTNISNAETADYVLKTNADGTYTWVAQASGGGSAITIQDEGSALSTAASTINFVGSGVVASGTGATKTITINSGGSSANTFGTIAIGGTNIVADTATDTLNLVAGANITLTANSTSDTITIASAGGGGGGGTDLNSLNAGVIDVAADSIGFIDNNDSSTSKKETIVDLVEAIAGTGLSGSAGVLSSTITQYANADVNAHLNTSSAANNEVLSWTGSDFDWVAQSGGGGGSSTFAALTEIALADLDVHDIAVPATSVHVMTPNGSSSYRSDIHGTTENPTLYVNAGETIAFDLTGVTASHPFQIQTTSDSAYNTGLIHIAPDGTKTTGSSAQGKTSGTLYWKVPGSISGDYEYICTAHSGMKGTITIKDPSAAAGGVSRVTETETTASTSDGASASVEFATLGKSFAIQKVTAEKESWIRIYSDTASRTADSSRTQGTDPSDGSGVIAEFIATSANTVFKVTPAIMGWLDDNETQVPVAVQNNTGGTTTTQVTITALKIES